MPRSSLTALAAVFLIFAAAVPSAMAAERCTTPDCSDVVPSPLVKDNLGRAKDFYGERDFKRHAENSRRYRTKIQRREAMRKRKEQQQQ